MGRVRFSIPSLPSPHLNLAVKRFCRTWDSTPRPAAETKGRRKEVTPTLYNGPMKILLQIPIMIACLVALVVLSHLLSRVLSRVVHRDWLYSLLLAPGTILHELCHASACLVTLTPIYEIHLFRFKREPDGTVQLGEVVHRDTGPVRNFFIATAPLFGASLLVYGLSIWLLPRGATWTDLLASGWTYLFLVAVFFIALSLSPSRQDLKALPGFLVVALVLGSAGYFVVLALSKKWNLSGAAEAVESGLRTANRGLIIVLVAVVVVYGVLLVLERAFRRV